MSARPLNPTFLFVGSLLTIVLGLFLSPEVRSQPEKVDHDTSCTICTGSSWIACGRCKAKGELTMTCEKCSGSKKVECPLWIVFGKGKDKVSVPCNKGKVDCINCWGKGKIVWTVGPPDPCKVCSRGKRPCPYCIGKRKIVCADCEV